MAYKETITADDLVHNDVSGGEFFIAIHIFKSFMDDIPPTTPRLNDFYGANKHYLSANLSAMEVEKELEKNSPRIPKDIFSHYS